MIPDTANFRREIFMAALDEIADVDVREELYNLIDALKRLLMAKGNLKEYAATNQAAEFVAACVWTGANARKG